MNTKVSDLRGAFSEQGRKWESGVEGSGGGGVGGLGVWGSAVCPNDETGSGSGFRGQGSGFRVQGLEFRVWGLGDRV